MRMSKLVGRKIKEDPKEATTVSHKFIIRGGYVRPVSTGIYSLLPLGKRIVDKIEEIIREEMNKIDGQEVLMPVVLPAELWKESGRFASVGRELLRFKDRNDKEMLLAMTHEEAIVHLVRTEITSYKQLPVMLYQLQTKYRDEARPRAGMIRVREFTMKDAYSFHADQESLDNYYEKAFKAYERIFKRIGLKDCLSIQSDPGMMGGSTSHEFMALADCGEDIIFMSPNGEYKANKEVAIADWEYKKEPQEELEKIHTPDKKTIEEVADFLGVKPENTGKAVFFKDNEGRCVFAMIRGDFEVNEAKLKKVLQSVTLEHADDETIKDAGAEPGFASPIGISTEKVRIIIDPSIEGSSNLVVGGNEKDYHFKNFNLERDMTTENVIIADIATVREGDKCSITGEPLQMRRGIEVGNIFKLGTKYTESMNCSYLDKNGKSKNMIMGCYGIGVGRAMASVIEQSYDKWGPIWPISISPYQVQLCALNPKKENVKTVAEQLYKEFTEAGIEVLYDDRGEKAGFMFNDADLTGIPLRIIISPKTIAEDKVEFKIRGTEIKELWSVEETTNKIKEQISKELEKFRIENK